MNRKLYFVPLIIPLLLACAVTGTPEPDPVLDPNWTPPSSGSGQSSNDDQPCTWTWHTENLPDHTDEVSDFLTGLDFEVIDVRASVFGENCSKNGEVTRFAAFATEYDVEVNVEADVNPEVVAADIITLLINEFPADTTPGPNPGTITVKVSDGTDTLDLRADGRLARNAVEEGLTGIDLLMAVGYEPAE